MVYPKRRLVSLPYYIISQHPRYIQPSQKPHSCLTTRFCSVRSQIRSFPHCLAIPACNPPEFWPASMFFTYGIPRQQNNCPVVFRSCHMPRPTPFRCFNQPKYIQQFGLVLDTHICIVVFLVSNYSPWHFTFHLILNQGAPECCRRVLSHCMVLGSYSRFRFHTFMYLIHNTRWMKY